MESRAAALGLSKIFMEHNEGNKVIRVWDELMNGSGLESVNVHHVKGICANLRTISISESIFLAIMASDDYKDEPFNAIGLFFKINMDEEIEFDFVFANIPWFVESQFMGQFNAYRKSIDLEDLVIDSKLRDRAGSFLKQSSRQKQDVSNEKWLVLTIAKFDDDLFSRCLKSSGFSGLIRCETGKRIGIAVCEDTDEDMVVIGIGTDGPNVDDTLKNWNEETVVNA